MKIRNTNHQTASFHDSDHMDDDYRVEFNGDGIAVVRETVGEALVASGDYPTIEAVDSEESDEDGDGPEADDEPPPAEASADDRSDDPQADDAGADDEAVSVANEYPDDRDSGTDTEDT